MRATSILGWMLLFIAPVDTLADDAGPCQVHVILFVASDVKPPTVPTTYGGRKLDNMIIEEAYIYPK